MFSSTFILLAALAKVALALNAGDLAVSLQAVHSTVDSAQDIIVTAVISNPTDKEVKVLAVNNVLDNSATKSFEIIADGKEVTFAGVEAVYDLTQDQAYVTIPAGQSVAVNHTTEFYDFSAFAPGTTFTISSRKNYYQGLNDDLIEVASNSVQVKADKVEFKIPEAFKDIYSAAPEEVSAFTSTPKCKNSAHNKRIVTGLKYARSLAGGARSNIEQDANSARFKKYFGGNKAADVKKRLDVIAGDQNQNRDITCANDNAEAKAYCSKNSGVIAYTQLVSSGGNIVRSNIFTCDLYMKSDETKKICDTRNYDGTMTSEGGIILHELSHATSGTSDLGYGCGTAAGLSTANKLNNADNYRCLALDVYLSWNCANGPK